MLLTLFFKFYDVDLTRGSSKEVTSTTEGRMEKDSKQKFTKAKDKFISSDTKSSEFVSDHEHTPIDKETRSKRKHDVQPPNPKKKKKGKTFKRMFVQLVKELQQFTDSQREFIKLQIKQMKRTAQNLRLCQDHWSLLLQHMDIYSSSSDSEPTTDDEV